MQSVLASLGVSGGPSGDGLASTAGQLPGLNLSAAFASPAAPAQQESEADVDDGEALSASQEQPSEEDVINGEMMEEEDEFGAYFVQNYGVEWSPPQPDPEDDEDDGDDSTSLAAPQQQSGGYDDDDDDEEGPAPPIAEQPRSSLLSDGVAVAFFRQGGQGQGQGQGGNGNGNGNASGGGGAGAGLGA